RYARFSATTLTIGASALGNACFQIIRDWLMPLSRAISIYGLANRLIKEARVMRIICAITTRLRVATGSTERSRSVPNVASGARLDRLGNQPSFTENTRISRYATKNSGNDTALNAVVLSRRSNQLLRYSAA